MVSSLYTYYDLDGGIRSDSISLIFEGWSGDEERIAVLSPHDDDALLGAGYLLSAVIDEGCEPYILIFCDGRGGFSRIEDKEKIVATRRVESRNAYRKLGVPEENLIRFEYPDFSLKPNIGWILPCGLEGTMTKTMKTLREIKPTRLLIPNEYREHTDHEALSYIGSYDGPQVGDAVRVDLGSPYKIRSFLKYSVWGDFSPEDAMLRGRDPALRGNVLVRVKPAVEARIIEALREFRSQELIIEGLVREREKRRLNGDDGDYIEVYLKFDPRPSIDYRGYKRRILEIDKNFSRF